ncbi:MAG: hypothetical protein MI810_02920 [Flavobacteriales bacterium]|nr:hypothetical protein [Flavobacteriales bacterium]
MKKGGFIFLVTLLAIACSKTKNISLQQVVDESTIAQQSFIALGVGAEYGYEEESKFPVFLWHEKMSGASNYRFFETKDKSSNPEDYGAYREVRKPVTSERYLGFMDQTKLKSQKDRWGIVTFELADSLWVSNPIALLPQSRATQSMEVWLEIDVEGSDVTFSWIDGSYKESTKYLMMISDVNQNVVFAGTTTELFWNLYDEEALTESLLYPTLFELEVNQNYSFTLIGLNENNWGTIYLSKTFATE